MQRFEPIEAIAPRRAQAYGEPVRRMAAMARAGLPVPPGFALGRQGIDQLLASALAADERPTALLEAQDAPDEAALLALRARVQGAALDDAWSVELARVDAELRAQGARALVLTAHLVCENPVCERALFGPRLGIDREGDLEASLRASVGALFEPSLFEALRAAGARDAGVSVAVQSMVDGVVSGVVYTRHPLTGDASEWLVRAGYGLASAVRDLRVGSDVIRVARDGTVRDVVVRSKARMETVLPDGSREERDAPAPLIAEPALSPGALQDVLGLAERTERHVGQALRMDFSIAQGRVYLLEARVLPGPSKLPRARRAPERRRDLWSHAEVGEALPHVLTPLAWSLLRRFARAGVEHAVSASGVRLDAGTELIREVRGRAYLNLGLLSETALRLPGITPEALARVGLRAERGVAKAIEPLGPVELARAALRLYDSHVRFGRRIGAVSSRVAGERGHFAGLDARLLSPDSVERVLCDVEAWLFDVGTALMHTYGVWFATLVALRALLARYAGDGASRLERDLLWGQDELTSLSTARELTELAHKLSRDAHAVGWADSDERSPAFIRDSLLELTSGARHEGAWLLDPASPRWCETPERLEGVLRAMLTDPMTLALSIERREVARGRRERAEREWKRVVPFALWPLLHLLVRRLRDLTRHRESLLADTVRAISVVRDIAKDASRRLAARYRDIGQDAAFFLELEELHAALARGQWDVRTRVAERRAEYELLRSLPRASARFQGGPAPVEAGQGPVHGVSGSGGAAEGRIVHVRDGSELSRLPRAAVLVVPACDVGLCAILPAVRAVVCEQGGLSSHGAMLASALSVPMIVGAEGASARLIEGERVRVDADVCVVQRLERSS